MKKEQFGLTLVEILVCVLVITLLGYMCLSLVKRFGFYAVPPFVIFVTLSVAWTLVPEKRRKRRFLAREIMEFDLWYEKYYGSTRPDKQLTREAHSALMRDVGAKDLTQIHPTDRFTKELIFDEWWASQMDNLLEFEHWVAKYTKSKGVPKSGMEQLSHCETVGAFVSTLGELTKASQAN